MESKTESIILRVADFHLHLVKRKVDEVFVARRRERRLNGSKIIILSGVNLEKSVRMIHYNFPIYTKEPHTKSNLFSEFFIISV